MKKDKKISLGLLALMVGAVGMGGCAKKVSQSCVDKNGVVVADKYCNTSSAGHTAAMMGAGYLGYRWYYGGGYHSVGSHAYGGGYSRPSGHVSVVKSSSSSRGGFGRSSSSHGGSSS